MGSAAPGLREYLAVLWRRRVSIAATVLTVVLAAAAYSTAQPKTYAATTDVLVRPVTLSPTAPANARDVVMEDERRVATSAEVSSIAAELVAATGQDLAGVSVRTGVGSSVLSFRSTSRDPADARATAQAYADAYLRFRLDLVLDDLRAASEPLDGRIAELDRELDELQRRIFEAPEVQRPALQIRFNSLFAQRTTLEQKRNELTLPEDLQVGRVLQPAALPRAPFSPNHERTLLFAIVAGLGLALLQAFARDHLDDHVRGGDDLARLLGMRVLAELPADRGDAPWAAFDPRTPAGVAYDDLAALVLAARTTHGHPLSSLTITTAGSAGAKAAVASNLAVALAHNGQRTVLISTNVDDPRIGDFLAQPQARAAAEGRAMPLETSVDGLAVVGMDATVPAARWPGVVRDVLRSAAAARPALVLVDAPALAGSAAAQAVAGRSDGVLVVEEVGRAHLAEINDLVTILEQAHANVIGAALSKPAEGADRRHARATRAGGVARPEPAGVSGREAPDAAPQPANATT